MTDNRDRYIAQSKATKDGSVGALPPRESSVRCTCAPSRGLACRKCYAPHYDAGLHLVGLTKRAPLIDPRKVAAQLAAMCRSQLPAIVGDDHAND